MRDFENYIKNLKTVRYNLIKFCYSNCSEWLKRDIRDCIFAIENEIKTYEIILKKYESETNVQLTIFDLVSKQKKGC